MSDHLEMSEEPVNPTVRLQDNRECDADEAGGLACPDLPPFGATVEYDGYRRRYLRLNIHHRVMGTGCTQMLLHFNPKHRQPWVAIRWWNWASRLPKSYCESLEITVSLRRVGRPSVSLVAKPVGDELPVRHRSLKFPGDSANWVSLLSISRQVAANLAPTEAIVGFIEDNMPSPWNLLATDTPIALFQALCPVPLAVQEDRM